VDEGSRGTGSRHEQLSPAWFPSTTPTGYWVGAHDAAKTGIWNDITLRRPLGGAFRSACCSWRILNARGMLLLQAFLVSRRDVLRHGLECGGGAGPWAGLAFFALTYTLVRAYVPTNLTEPLALFWALLAVPFFIEALAPARSATEWWQFALPMASLMTRLGSMFTIPALLSGLSSRSARP
jgi:hypothetical protein